MKYIDADKLIAEIERLYDGEAPKHDKQCDFDDGYFTGIGTISNFIDSLQQEQPESSKGKFVFPNYLYARTVDNKTIDVSYAPTSLDAVEYIKNDPTEQPDVDLEKEFDDFLERENAYVDDNNKISYYNGSSFDHTCDIYPIAHYFYELGKNARKEK